MRSDTLLQLRQDAPSYRFSIDEVWMHIRPSGSIVIFLTLLSGSPLSVSSILKRYSLLRLASATDEATTINRVISNVRLILQTYKKMSVNRAAYGQTWSHFENVGTSALGPTKMRAISAVLYHLGLPGIPSHISSPLITRFSKRMFVILL